MEKQTKRIQVMLGESQLRELKRMANRDQISVSAVVRQAVLSFLGRKDKGHA